MSDGGKGSAPRPFAVDQFTFASNWDRIFGNKAKPITVTVPADLPAEDLRGVAERSIAASSNLATGSASKASHDVGSNPTAPATYIPPDGYSLVYQGGHHDVYCNGQEHVYTTGGYVGHDRMRGVPDREIRRSCCDCSRWRDSDSWPGENTYIDDTTGK